MLLISSPFLALTYFLICFSLFRPRLFCAMKQNINNLKTAFITLSFSFLWTDQASVSAPISYFYFRSFYTRTIFCFSYVLLCASVCFCVLLCASVCFCVLQCLRAFCTYRALFTCFTWRGNVFSPLETYYLIFSLNRLLCDIKWRRSKNRSVPCGMCLHSGFSELFVLCTYFCTWFHVSCLFRTTILSHSDVVWCDFASCCMGTVLWCKFSLCFAAFSTEEGHRFDFPIYNVIASLVIRFLM